MSEDDTEEFDPARDDTDGTESDADAEESSAPPDDPITDPDGDEQAAGDEDPFADIEGVDVEDDPFADFDTGDETGTDDSSADSLFTEMEVSELDEDEVWAQLAEGEAANGPAETEPESATGVGSEAVSKVADAATSGERVVEKRAYCEQCEYFSKPPDVACTYPNSEIVELVDTERFRVRNCPIVARRENSDITAIAGGGDDSELEPGDPTAAADSGSED